MIKLIMSMLGITTFIVVIMLAILHIFSFEFIAFDTHNFMVLFKIVVGFVIIYKSFEYGATK